MSDTPAGKLAWIERERLEAPMGWYRYCEAPRHRGSFTPASYVIAFVGEGPEDGERACWSACRDCTEAIARDLGTTAEAGAIRG